MQKNIGTISESTMCYEDLIPAFLDCLEGQDTLTDEHKSEAAGIRERAESESYYLESGDCFDDLRWLFDALDEYSPPYFYFGANEGDGADYGFWLLQDALDAALQDKEIIKVDDLADIPADWLGDVLLVSDHGNLTLYQAKREWIEVWGLV